MGFYVIVRNEDENLSFDKLLQNYDFSFNYDGTLVDESLRENENTGTIRIEVRKCT